MGGRLFFFGAAEERPLWRFPMGKERGPPLPSEPVSPPPAKPKREGHPLGHPPQGSCFEAAITGSKGYKAGVTAAVTPVLYLGFCGAKSDARCCGQWERISIQMQYCISSAKISSSLQSGRSESLRDSSGRLCATIQAKRSGTRKNPSMLLTKCGIKLIRQLPVLRYRIAKRIASIKRLPRSHATIPAAPAE